MVQSMSSSIVAALLVQLFVSEAFHMRQLPQTTTGTTFLNALSRRDILSLIPSATIATGSIFALPQESTAAAKKAVDKAPTPTLPAINPLSFQGVFLDANHPKGYRVLIGDTSKGTMQLQDDPEGKTYKTPFKVETDKKTNQVKLKMDFSPKGGPKDIVAVLGTAKNGGTTLRFADGNVWKKETGIEGVYKDGKDPKFTRVIRREKGSKLVVDLINGSKTTTITAKAGSPKVSFDFPGKLGDKGTINPKKNTISFSDGNMWTKY